MSARGRRLAAITLSLIVLTVPAALAAPPDATGRYIVVLVDSVNEPAAVAREHSQRFDARVSHVFETVLNGYAATVAGAELGELQADPRVAYVSVDEEVHALGEIPTGVDRIDADVASPLSLSASVTTPVAVIDTGIDPSHPDLNVAGGYNCVAGATSWADQNGHGTHVAGTIAAKQDGLGVAGVAPGAPVYSVRVLDENGSGSWSGVICGIEWVTESGVKIANMSLGGSGRDGRCTADALHQAICNSVAAGVTHVVAAGNSGTNFSRQVPATYDQVLTVTAMADFDGAPGGLGAATCRSETDDAYAGFSNFATPDSADANHTIAAPGVCITSTWPGGGYDTISGTSMASPHVAGTVALCASSGACAGMTPAQIISELRSTAAAQPAAFGFAGDPNHRSKGKKYYGHLTYGGGY